MPVSEPARVVAEFYRNFTNGNACSRLVLVDAEGHEEDLDAGRPSAQLSLIAPVSIQSAATCISSRLATDENVDLARRSAVASGAATRSGSCACELVRSSERAGVVRSGAVLLPIGIALLALGLIGLIYGIVQRLKAGRLTDAPLVSTGDVAMRGRAAAGPKGQISAQGNVICHQPVIAPFTGIQCLYYEIKCTARWKDGDTAKSKIIDEQKVAAQFMIDDGSGAVAVDAREGGDFEPMQRKSEMKGTGLIGGLVGAEMQFGNYRVNTPILDVGTKYEVEEELLPLVPRLYACGRVGEGGNFIASPSWRQLIVSAKSRDELLASATKTAKIALLAGGALLLVGGGTATAGTLMARSHSPDTAAAVGTAPTPSATSVASVTASVPLPGTAPMASVAPAVSSAEPPAVAPPKKKKGKGKAKKK